MSCWAIIPVKGPGQGKARLADVLGSAERDHLVDTMLAHVAVMAGSARGIDRVCLLGPSHRGLELPLLAERKGGLNAALRGAIDDLPEQEVTRVVVVFADLPLLTALDLELLAAAAQGVVAIGPDRHGTGTNALSLPMPEAAGFAFAFGPDSFARHQGEAARLGLRVEVIQSPGLAHDIDEPADLPDAAHLLERTR